MISSNFSIQQMTACFVRVLISSQANVKTSPWVLQYLKLDNTLPERWTFFLVVYYNRWQIQVKKLDGSLLYFELYL